MLLKYYNKFKMRFTTTDFTTEWQSLEVGVGAGCTISGILFVLVMEMLLRSTNCESALVRVPLRAFMDDVTIIVSKITGAKGILARLDKLIEWSRMKFKANKHAMLRSLGGGPIK